MVWARWLCALLGIWVLLSPWLLQYSDNGGATWSSVIVGVVIALLSLLSSRKEIRA